MKIPFFERRGASRTQSGNHVMTWMKKPEWLWLLIGGTSGLLLGIILVSLFSSDNTTSDHASSAASVSGTQVAEAPEPVFDFYTVLPESEGGGTKKLTRIDGFSNPSISNKKVSESAIISSVAVEKNRNKKVVSDKKSDQAVAERTKRLVTTDSGKGKMSEDTDAHNKRAEHQDDLVKTTPNGHYLLQTGSFRRRADADRMRARLLLLGLEPQIKKVQISNGEYWHRVQLGPFDSVSDLQPVKTMLANKKMDTLVLKIR
ncbi:Cell division protein FtsN [invertebrate metagenome]|uniref:Cell division protein FtsN n=1 Tax=invertebrate metagenome TaxID=1711999 RepID=A0A2H9T6L6_9ZZZZ